MTTTVGRAEDALPHLIKMTDLLEREAPRRVQATIWFVARSLKDLGRIKATPLLRVNSLLKAGAHIEAAMALAPEGCRLVKLEEEGARWGATVRRALINNSTYASGSTPGAAVAAAFATQHILDLRQEGRG